MMLTVFDYFVLTVIVLSALRGAWRGLINELFSLVGWLAAIWLASRYAHYLTIYIPANWPGGHLTQWILAFAAIAITVTIASSALSALLGQLFNHVLLKQANQLLGFGFGMLRGMIIVLVLFVLAFYTEIPKKTFWKQALSRPKIQQMIEIAYPHLPVNIQTWIKNTVNGMANNAANNAANDAIKNAVKNVHKLSI